MSKVAAVVLAAGRSSRYRAAGGAEATKLVAEIRGKPIVRRVVEAALASRARPVVVVIGHARERGRGALSRAAGDDRGQPGLCAAASPPRCARAQRAAVRRRAARVVLLGDMPNVDARLIDR